VADVPIMTLGSSGTVRTTLRYTTPHYVRYTLHTAHYAAAAPEEGLQRGIIVCLLAGWLAGVHCCEHRRARRVRVPVAGPSPAQ
jgi:hypothetical protein